MRLKAYLPIALLACVASLWLAGVTPVAAQQTAKVVATCGTAGYTAGTTNYVTQDTTGAACGNASGGGGGGAVTIADGADVTLGAKADAATCATTNTLIACERQIHADLLATPDSTAAVVSVCATPTSSCTWQQRLAAIQQAAGSNAIVVGPGASGAALSGNPVRIAGSDGTSTQDLKTDTSGRITPSTDTHAQCSALCANLVVKASAGTLKTFEVSADSTLAGAIWYVIVYDATSAPVDGAVTPAKCYQQASGSTQMGGTLSTGGSAFATGITIGVSTTGCFTKTASTHAFIAADYQ